MSTYCNYASQHCRDQCCDRLGGCPEVSGYTCYFYYNSVAQNTTIPGAAIAGVIIGGIFLVVGTIVLIVWCIRIKRKEKEEYRPEQTVIAGVNKGIPIPVEQTAIIAQVSQPYIDSLSIAQAVPAAAPLEAASADNPDPQNQPPEPQIN